MDDKLKELRGAYDAAVSKLQTAKRAYDALPEGASYALEAKAIEGAVDDCDSAKDALETYKAAGRLLSITVDEPDMYGKNGRSFMTDLFAAKVQGDPTATERIARHQAYEVEKYAVSSATVGGVIPPQYLVDLYAKASRNGRVFADQVNHQDIPEEGMSMIVPRLTGGSTAAVQATESTAVATQDPTESDLTVPVRTVAGYLPVSRQTLERGAYSDAILFEDLVARYWSTLDVQCLTGSGSSGQILGAFNVVGIAASTASTATVVGVWPKMADVIQQINTAVGGLGYVADKIVMHPRRWGFFEAALDSQNRPIFGIDGLSSFNTMGGGEAAGYGLVGRMHGLPVYTDANIPTNQGAGTNQDAIIVMASSVVHLWESPDGRPITLSFEQTAGTALQTQLIAYGYAGFTAGRYPAGFGAVTGSGLTPPAF